MEEYLFINENNKNNILEIKIKGLKTLISLAEMFSSCKSLISIIFNPKWNAKNIIGMTCTFYECNSLEALPNFNKNGFSNIIYIDRIFIKCSSLLSLLDISKWNIRMLLV